MMKKNLKLEKDYRIIDMMEKNLKLEKDYKIDFFWVEAIVQNKNESKPLLCKIMDYGKTLEEAMEIIAQFKNNYNVLSVWIDKFDKNKEKHTIFHECYIDAFGNISK